MKQVWQAEDGTVFDTEKECEKYEDMCSDCIELKTYIVDQHCFQDSTSFMIVIQDLLESNKAHLITNYINSWSNNNETISNSTSC